MQLIHSRTTMLAREASSREEELVAMKVVELKEELGERAEALSGNKGVAAPPAARRYSERVFGERRGRCRRVEPYVECPKFSRACGARLLPFCPGRAHFCRFAPNLRLAVLLAF